MYCSRTLTLSQDPHLYFDVIVEGPLDFAVVEMMLDTGATFVSIPTSVALELGYDIDHPESTLPITTASGVVRAPIITLDSIEVLDVKATNVNAMCIDMPGSMIFAGLLGLSFLRNFDVDLHFKSGAIRFR